MVFVRSNLVYRRFLVGFFLAGLMLSAAHSAVAQAVVGQRPGGNPKSWSEPIEPFRIAGPIYYVGTRGLSVFLIKTSNGDILLGGAVPGTAPLIERPFANSGSSPTTFASCCSITPTSITLGQLPPSRS